jgi:hypothetical protein
MEAQMRVIVAIVAGLIALPAVSAQAAPDPENRRPLSAVLSLDLGDHACGEGRHQMLRRDWRGDWWWGLCAPNR